MPSTARAAVLATGGGLAAAAAVLAGVAFLGPSSAVRVAVPPLPTDAGDRATVSSACAELAARLPDALTGAGRRPTLPGSDRTAAYGDPAVVLRCGVPAPARFVLGEEPLGVDDVFWFPDQSDPSAVVWTTVDRTVRLEVRVPTSIADQGALLVPLADPVRAALPEAPIAPLPLP